MSLYEICERCDEREDCWNVHEAHISIGELHRKPHLCAGCTVTVMSALLVALRPLKSASRPSPEAAKEPTSE